jgi:Lar family restriction alleviation protein
MKGELLPCPFCGGKDVRITEGMIALRVWCQNEDCLANIEGEVSEEGATAAWNRRAMCIAASTGG